MSKDFALYQPYANAYKNRFDVFENEHFENFIGQWEYIKDNLVIFLGAGASVGAVNMNGDPFPTALFLRNELWKRFMLQGTERESFDFSNLGLMSLEHASAIVEAHTSRGTMMDILKDLFRTDKCLWQHAVLQFLGPDAIFTTNYDTLIELGWQCFSPSRRLKEVYYPVVKNGYTPLYKPHGSIDNASKPIAQGGVVITQFDYYEIINNRKAMLDSLFEQIENKYVLFLGYSFMDFDISSIVFDYARRVNRRNWYAVFPRNDSKISNMYLTKFGIRVIPATFFEFMLHLDKEVSFVPEPYKFQNLTQSQRETLQGF